VVVVSGGGGGGSRLRTVVLPFLLCASFSCRCVSFLFSSLSTSASPYFYVLKPSKFPGSFLFFTPKIPTCSYFSLCSKPPECRLLLSFSKIFAPWFSFFFLFLPFFLFSPFSVFIAIGREGHLTTVMAQGKVATLPMSWHRVGWLVMACINGGRVWDVACVFGQVRRARQIERITGKDLKSSSSLPLHGHERRRTMPFKTTLFWFVVYF